MQANQTRDQPSLELRVADDPTAVARLRGTLAQVAEEAGLSDEASFELRLASTEAVANALRHPEGPGTADVTVRADETGVEVEVVSPGPFRLRADSDTERGRGLPLMVALSDEAEFLRRGDSTCVRLRKLVR
jgi:anti-sigma regulatory factor (Ser/Thr protein kinase)